MDALRSRRSHLAGQAIIAVVLVVLVGLMGRLVYISVHDGPLLLARAARQQRSVIPLNHRRGLIVDRVGRIISGTLLRKSVFADPKILPDRRVAAEKAAEVLGLEPCELCEDLLAAGDRRFFVIRRGVTIDEAERIKNAGVYGLGVFDEPYRTYPMSGLAAALVGFVAADGHGVSGLEYQCDAWLRGENGVKTIVRDAQRKAFWLADGGYRAARDGFHVVLTIDAEIQSTVERELAAGVERYRAEGGVAIVMHPKTGEILAMANVPGFDPNCYGDYGASRYRNRAITDPYEPGSTFKPFVAAAALADGAVKLGEVFDCEEGTWQDGRRVLHDHHPYGLLTFEDIVIKSSNIGMAKIGKCLGNERLYRGLKAFGFGEKTGVDLLGEDPGIVRPLVRWDGYTTTSVPMGHEVATTPLQLARAFCALANGGKLIQPYVIRAVVAADGRVVRDFSDPPAQDRALPANVANIMKDKVLCAAVNEGTGKNAQLARYQVFGKTGTAQIAARGGSGYKKQRAYVGSFVGAAPARDPELVVFVAIRRPDPSLAYYGGTVAAPVFREILTHALAYLRIPPDRPAAPLTTVSAAGG
ncbi:MAG: penicillin-binding protein 2 [Phycisphaerae bacterium]|nr:penicillin-binding protein 2 [Phycisphaerae bacterium]